MKKSKNTVQTKKERTPLIKTRVKRDKAIEIEIQKSPGKTLIGKILIITIVLAMTVLGLIGLILLIIQVSQNL